MASSVASSVSPWSMSSLRAALPCKSNNTTSCKRDAPCCLQMRTYTTVPKLRSGAVVVSEPRRLLGSSYYGLVRENPLFLVGSAPSFEQKFEGIRTLGIFRAMRHGRRVPKLNRPPDQRNAILRGLTTQVLKHGRVLTTLTRAKATRSHVDKMITLAKDGSLQKRRQVLSFVYDKQTVHSLFAEVQDRYGDRNGGFTRIIRALPRRGDNAPMAYLELV